MPRDLRSGYSNAPLRTGHGAAACLASHCLQPPHNLQPSVHASALTACRYWRATHAVRLGDEGCKSEVASPYAATPALLDTICSVVSTACRSAVALQLPVLRCAPSPYLWFGSALKRC